MGAVGVLGGDERQVYLAKALKAQGETVYVSALEEAPGLEELPSLTLEELAGRCGKVFLPLPVSRDAATLNAPFSKEKLPLDDRTAKLFSGCVLYGGMLSGLWRASPAWKENQCRDYYDREELVLGNALLTAEGAVGLAIQKLKGSLFGSDCLVAGFGRIGKSLCLDLKGLGARVDCCARSPRDLVLIEGLGLTPLSYSQAEKRYDAVFNTVPTLVIDERILSLQGPDTLLMELASAPGGFHREAARRFGLTVTDAQGLPGRFSPKASADLILKTVKAMERESGE